MIKVSVIISAYNAERYITECLDSIIKQNFDGYEIIIVNDGSKDATASICQKYIDAHDDVSIKLIEQKNAGVSAARNRGMEEAEGEWVTFLDADDLLLENVIPNLNSNDVNKSDIILCEYTRVPEKTSADALKSCFMDSEQFLRCALRYPKYYENIKKTYNIDPYVNWACWAKLYRREWLVKNDIRFPKGIFTSEDFLFLLRVYSHEPKILATNSVTYYYRTNEQSVTHNFNPRVFDNYNAVFNYIEQELSSYKPCEDIDTYVSRQIVDCMRYYQNHNGNINNDQILKLTEIFYSNKYHERVLRCPMKKVFIGKKNQIFGTYWLLKLKKLYRKLK